MNTSNFEVIFDGEFSLSDVELADDEIIIIATVAGGGGGGGNAR